MTASTVSELVISAIRDSDRLVQKQLAWVRMAPFGAPRVPEVKMISNASSSADRSADAGCAPSPRPSRRRDHLALDAADPSARPRQWVCHQARGRPRRGRRTRPRRATVRGPTRSSCWASSRGESRHDSGTSTRPAFAQAKNSTTWSALLPVSGRDALAHRVPGSRSRSARRGARSSSSRVGEHHAAVIDGNAVRVCASAISRPPTEGVQSSVVHARCLLVSTGRRARTLRARVCARRVATHPTHDSGESPPGGTAPQG